MFVRTIGKTPTDHVGTDLLGVTTGESSRGGCREITGGVVTAWDVEYAQPSITRFGPSRANFSRRSDDR